MRITRSGSERYHGPAGVRMKHRSAGWDPDHSALRLKYYHVEDFNTPAHHDWTVYVEVEELRVIVDALAPLVFRTGAPRGENLLDVFQG